MKNAPYILFLQFLKELLCNSSSPVLVLRAEVQIYLFLAGQYYELRWSVGVPEAGLLHLRMKHTSRLMLQELTSGAAVQIGKQIGGNKQLGFICGQGK